MKTININNETIGVMSFRANNIDRIIIPFMCIFTGVKVVIRKHFLLFFYKNEQGFETIKTLMKKFGVTEVKK